LLEAQDWIMATIEKDVFRSLLPLLEGESLFKLIAEFKAAEEVKGNVSYQKAEEETLDREQ